MMGSTMYAAIQAVTPRPNTPAIALELMMTEPKPVTPPPCVETVRELIDAAKPDWSPQDAHLTERKDAEGAD